jgi:hypothetical protein
MNTENAFGKIAGVAAIILTLVFAVALTPLATSRAATHAVFAENATATW